MTDTTPGAHETGSERGRAERWRSLLGASVVFLAAVVTYRRTTEYWFVTADSLPLLETSRVRTVADLAGLFTHPLMHGSSFTEVALFYRPLSSLSYALDYSVWGLVPAGYHLTNVALHGVAAVLVVLTVAEVTQRLAVGSLAGLLFAVHPLAAGVVPAIARRQDVLLAVFVLATLFLVVRARREGRLRLLGGALVTYALALGAKETALVVPGLVFAWLAIDRDGRWRSRLRGAIPATLPFVGVTVVYTVVRVAVLGGLGGYRSGVGSAPDGSAVFVPLKYVLWVAQPTSVVDATLATLPQPLLLAVAVGGGLAGVVLAKRTRGRERGGRLVPFGWVACGGLFAALALVLVATGRPTPPTAAVGEEWRTAVRYLVDSLFVGGCLVGLATAVLACDPPFDAATRRQVGFFGWWLVAIPGLLVVTGAGLGTPLELSDQIQTGYLCVIPAMAGLALVLVRSLEGAFPGGVLAKHPGMHVAVVVLAAALLGALLAASPLVHPYPEWEAAGDSNQRALVGADAEPDAATTAATRNASAAGNHTPMTTSEKRLQGYSVEAWSRLRASPRKGWVAANRGFESEPERARPSNDST